MSTKKPCCNRSCKSTGDYQRVITPYQLFSQAPQAGSDDVKPVSEPEDTSLVKPANNSSGCVVS